MKKTSLKKQNFSLFFQMSSNRKRKVDEEDEQQSSSNSSPKKKPSTNSYGFQNSTMPSFLPAHSLSDDETDEEHRKTSSAKQTNSSASNSTGFSSVIDKMMKKQNYDPSRGLGRNAVAPTKIIEDSKQRGQRGLGFTYKAFENESADWNFNNDPAPVDEDVSWCPHPEEVEAPLHIDELREWIELGPKKLVIDDEIEFADEEILREMLNSKTIFDELEQKEMEEARARSNVYETIGASIFLNRAAVKMANIDSVFNRMFTEPKFRDGQQSLVHPEEPFYFADVCAGPGGFSEYILWKKQWRAKGFGFTLKGKSDFTLHKFLVGPPETFDTFYGVGGINGDGDVFRTENIEELRKYILNSTQDQGVHMMMADGGFSVEGQENIQEILSKQLYLCQFLTALSIVRPDGHFVCKLFDLFTPFSVGLIYLMYRTFNHISIHKPVTSRPANSERYIICKNLRGSVRDVVRTYFIEINDRLNQLKNDRSSTSDILSIVPLEILKKNELFYEYIRESNNSLGSLQIRNLKKIRAFVSNRILRDDRQNEIRTNCLAKWELPDQNRPKFPRLRNDEVQHTLFPQLGPGIENVLLKMPTLLKQSFLNSDRIQSLFDYRCVLSLGEPILLLSCGRNFVFQFELKRPNAHWAMLDRTPSKIELPSYTLLLAERVREKLSESRNDRARQTIYLIDAFFIGKENLMIHNGRPTIFTDRFRSLKILEKTINKPCRTDLAPIRVIEQLRLEQIDEHFQKLRTSTNDIEHLEFTNINVENSPRIPVRGLWIFKFVQHPWTVVLSRTRNNKYFHNQKTRESIPAAPSDCSHVPSLRSMLENSFYWDFNDPVDSVTKSSFLQFIQEKNADVHSHQRH